MGLPQPEERLGYGFATAGEEVRGYGFATAAASLVSPAPGMAEGVERDGPSRGRASWQTRSI